MKAILKNLALVTVFAVAFSNLSGCGGSASPANSAGNTATTKPGAKSSDYPPLVASLANADLELLDGTVTKVADRKGKVLLLNLWATWCGPCRGEMPHLIEMQDKYRDQDFQVLGLNVGNEGGPETNEEIKKFAEMMKLNYELARISEDTMIQFYKATNFQAIPITVLVDREGRLRGVFLGGGPNVIKSMKEVVAKVVAGEDTADMANQAQPAPNSSEVQRMELKPASDDSELTDKGEKTVSNANSSGKK